MGARQSSPDFDSPARRRGRRIAAARSSAVVIRRRQRVVFTSRIGRRRFTEIRKIAGVGRRSLTLMVFVDNERGLILIVEQRITNRQCRTSAFTVFDGQRVTIRDAVGRAGHRQTPVHITGQTL